MPWETFYIPETEQERKEREVNEEKSRRAFRAKQLACPHTNYYETGHGSSLDIEGKIYTYITVECPDCWHTDEIELSLWRERQGAGL